MVEPPPSGGTLVLFWTQSLLGPEGPASTCAFSPCAPKMSILLLLLLAPLRAGGACSSLCAAPCVYELEKISGTGGTGYVNGAGAVAQFYEPYQLGVDASNNLYFGTRDNYMRKVTPAGVASFFIGDGTATWSDGTGAAASVYRVRGTAVHPSNSFIYFSDSLNHRIRRASPAGVTTTIAGRIQGLADGVGTNARFDTPCV